MYYLIFIITFILVILSALYSGRKVSSSVDFMLGGRELNSFQVASVIVGTLVGGASTIGTVQLAVVYGMAAWIFTLGSGIACLLLGLFFTKALRSSESVTISELIGNSFGGNVRRNLSILSSIGMFIHVIAQFLASMAVLTAIFHFDKPVILLIVFLIFTVFVISGGLKSASFIGSLKIFMLYALFGVSMLIIFVQYNGVGNIESLSSNNLLSLFSYGTVTASTDLLFMIIGVLSTQVYLQAIFSAKSVRIARNGAFIGAVLIPPIGLAAVCVGLFIRSQHPELTFGTAEALPFYINTYFPKSIAAIFMAFLLVVIAGTGSGLVLGVTTTIFNDILKLGSIKVLRITAVFILLLTSMVVYFNLESYILKWSFLSMGLRGTSVFLPLIIVIFFRNAIDRYCLKRFIYLPLLIYFMYLFL